MPLILPLSLPLMLLAGACSPPDNASGAGGVRAGEARALDDAAEMLDNQQLPAAAVPAAQKTPAPQPPPVQQNSTTAVATALAKPAG